MGLLQPNANANERGLGINSELALIWRVDGSYLFPFGLKDGCESKEALWGCHAHWIRDDEFVGEGVIPRIPMDQVVRKLKFESLGREWIPCEGERRVWRDCHAEGCLGLILIKGCRCERGS